MISCFIFKFLEIKEKFKDELLGSMTLFEVGLLGDFHKTLL